MKPQNMQCRTLLCAFIPLSLAGCESVANFQGRCEEEGAAVSVTGSVSEGKGQETPPEIPFKVKAKIESDVVIREVLVGKTPAELDGDPDKNEWTATLFEQDLEAARDQQRGVAILPVVAVDSCEGKHALDTIEVPLGPAPGQNVSNLVIDLVLTPADECFLPSDNSVPALLRVRASAASAGASVELKSNQGEFSGGMTHENTTTLELKLAGNEAKAEAYFVPGTIGTAVFTASAPGALAEPKSILVVGAPEVDLPSGALVRGLVYTVVFRSRGNLKECVSTETAPGAAELTLVEPPLGVFTNTVSVFQEPKACTDVETLKMSVRFDANAPDGASVKLRCSDTYGQEQGVTLEVEDGP